MTAVEAIGDITATEEASRIPTNGADHRRRIQGGLLGDGGVPSILLWEHFVLTSCTQECFSQTEHRKDGIKQLHQHLGLVVCQKPLIVHNFMIHLQLMVACQWQQCSKSEAALTASCRRELLLRRSRVHPAHHHLCTEQWCHRADPMRLPIRGRVLRPVAVCLRRAGQVSVCVFRA